MRDLAEIQIPCVVYVWMACDLFGCHGPWMLGCWFILVGRRGRRGRKCECKDVGIVRWKIILGEGKETMELVALGGEIRVA